MKRIIILILVLCTLNTSATYGQSKQKVAVYVTGGEDDSINEFLSELLVNAFINNGKYTVVDRSASLLAEVDKEQKFQRSGNVADNEVSRLGKQSSVQLVCMVTVKDVLEGKKYVSAQLIDVESGEIINTAGATLSSMNELMKATKDITAKLTSETADKQAGYVITGKFAVQIARSESPDWETANATAQSSTTGEFNDWRLPTIDELSLIFGDRDKIWNNDEPFDFMAGAWSSDSCDGGHKYLAGNEGENFCSKDMKTDCQPVAICVRDIKE
jgi:hypothetical protein